MRDRELKGLRDKYLKISGAFLLLLIICIFLCSSINNEKSYSNNEKYIITAKDEPEEWYDKFCVDKISITERKNKNIVFSLSAERIVHRKRISRLFVYQNLKEIFMRGVKIDIYPDNTHDNTHKVPLDVFSSFRFFGKPSTSMEDYLAGNVDIDFDLLTRLLIKDLSLNIHYLYGQKISINAESAIINADFENIVFEGPVKIILSDGRNLYAYKAVWSKKFSGIYLPNGYTFQNGYHKGKAFFIINTKGKFYKISSVPDIKYTDLIEEKEKVLYAQISKKMPPYLKFIFGEY